MYQYAIVDLVGVKDCGLIYAIRLIISTRARRTMWAF